MPQKIKKKTMKVSCYEYAVYLLSIRLLSVGQLRQKLQKKGYTEAEIAEVIQRLSDLKYLNDEQFAQIYFENLIKYKLFGYFGIKKKLLERKIASAEVEKLLRKFSIADELVIARKAAAKNPRKTREQLVRLLSSKGFRSDVVFKVANVRLEDPDQAPAE